MTAKLLNLDEFTTDEKIIKLDGVDHKMREMTVQEFVLKAREAREKVLSADEKDAADTLEGKIQMAVDMIHDGFPTITKDRLGRLGLPQLNAILEFTITPPEKLAESAKGNA